MLNIEYADDDGLNGNIDYFGKTYCFNMKYNTTNELISNIIDFINELGYDNNEIFEGLLQEISRSLKSE